MPRTFTSAATTGLIPASLAAAQNSTAPCKFGSVIATAFAPRSAANRTISSGRSNESMKLKQLFTFSCSVAVPSDDCGR